MELPLDTWTRENVEEAFQTEENDPSGILKFFLDMVEGQVMSSLVVVSGEGS